MEEKRKKNAEKQQHAPFQCTSDFTKQVGEDNKCAKRKNGNKQVGVQTKGRSFYFRQPCLPNCWVYHRMVKKKIIMLGKIKGEISFVGIYMYKKMV